MNIGYLGKISNDRVGRLLVNAFEEERVDINGIIIAQTGNTGIVTGYVSCSGERALYLNPGVNDLLKPEDIDYDYVKNTHYLHLSSFFGDQSFETQKRIMENDPSIRVTLDPGEIYARKGWKMILPLIRRCYAFLPNEHELNLLTGKKYDESAMMLLEMGVAVVAVKMGSKGCYVTDGKEEHLIPAFHVETKDTTGAGDAFCAGFLYGLLRGKNLKTCGILGNFVASRCITQRGARNGLPRIAEIPRFLK